MNTFSHFQASITAAITKIYSVVCLRLYFSIRIYPSRPLHKPKPNKATAPEDYKLELSAR